MRAMRRRDFITLVAGATAAWPLTARAQSPVPVIGFLSTESAHEWASRVRAFQQALSEMGFTEGKNVAVEYRWADGLNDRLPGLAAELVTRRVVLIAANGAAVPAAKAATQTIPIVFQFGGDPVELGFVASLNKPGGNLTGITSLTGDLGPKKLELLREVLPDLTNVAVLVNPTNPNNVRTAVLIQTAARSLGIQDHIVHARAVPDFDEAFAEVRNLRAAGLVITSDGFFNSHIEHLAALAVRYSVPSVFQYREFAAAGGLMGYGGTVTQPSYLVGLYTGRILKGEKPGDLPVQQSTKVELYINLKTAKALGITVPLSLLGRADEVIE
jgi:putative ABC transport system substrate-binding protein